MIIKKLYLHAIISVIETVAFVKKIIMKDEQDGFKN